MTRRHRFAAIALVAGLGLTACANNDAKESDVVNAMRDAGLGPDDAECVGQGFDQAFGENQDLFNDVASASEPEDLPEGTQDTIEQIFDDCGVPPAGAAAGDTDAEDGATDDDADTTGTTEAADEDTTTTEAP
ncbi:MAG TPA: hypothetical protein VFZ68_06590 [Acidimicrobiales bacterium]